MSINVRVATCKPIRPLWRRNAALGELRSCARAEFVAVSGAETFTRAMGWTGSPSGSHLAVEPSAAAAAITARITKAVMFTTNRQKLKLETDRCENTYYYNITKQACP